jgi:hypothetical protein
LKIKALGFKFRGCPPGFKSGPPLIHGPLWAAGLDTHDSPHSTRDFAISPGPDEYALFLSLLFLFFFRQTRFRDFARPPPSVQGLLGFASASPPPSRIAIRLCATATTDARQPTPDSRQPTPDSPTTDARRPTTDARQPTPDSKILVSDFGTGNLLC